jgi:SAM-dependent methyltransferase
VNGRVNEGKTPPVRVASAPFLIVVAMCSLATVGRDTPPGRSDQQRQARTPDIYFTPTREVVADAMLNLARVGAKDVVYDLGSGDGRIVILAAQKYGARGVGVELDPRLVEISRQVAREGNVADRVTFIEGDLFTADIGAATVVTLYLSPGINRRLEPKLRRELRPGARIVSHQFRIGTWTPDKTVRAEDGTDLFLWTSRPQ